jgi:oligopeptide/dipeptide ABC transporter ATP-binding protein
MLRVQDLTVSLGAPQPFANIASDVSFEIGKGEILGLVGESGCGKSMTSLAIMGLLRERSPAIASGSVLLDGRDVTHLAPHERVAHGSGGIAMIFQEPMTSLNPVLKVGDQIMEAIAVHERIALPAKRHRAQELLEMVRIPDAKLQLDAYPHQMSGGMRQRVMIAIALAARPKVLIADEPTTALDVTVQLQILSLLRELCDRLQMALLMITHDLGIIAQLADRVAVMYAGRLVETADVAELFARPAHPYTRALLSCLPNAAAPTRRLTVIEGQAPRPGEFRIGCAFVPRCTRAAETCRHDPLLSSRIDDGHFALCKFPVREAYRA